MGTKARSIEDLRPFCFMFFFLFLVSSWVSIKPVISSRVIDSFVREVSDLLFFKKVKLKSHSTIKKNIYNKKLSLIILLILLILILTVNYKKIMGKSSVCMSVSLAIKQQIYYKINYDEEKHKIILHLRLISIRINETIRLVVRLNSHSYCVRLWCIWSS